jgi:hypothetical protein
VSVDTRFVGSLWGLGSAAPAYANNLDTNDLKSFPTPAIMSTVSSNASSMNKSNYRDYPSVKGSTVNIFEPNNASSTASAYSVISGPSIKLVMLNFTVAAGLEHAKAGVRDRKYNQFGKFNQTTQQTFGTGVSDDGNKYDFIDTSVYIQANATGATISIPIRIVRRSA